MMPHSTNFETSAGALVLTNAILLYRGDGKHRGDAARGFATIHGVDHADDQPTISAGTPLSRDHLENWAEVLGNTVKPEILPENVLVSHPDMLAWWTPEQLRPSYFALSSPPKGLKALAERTTVSLPYPAHLFIATRSTVWVYALPASRRPIAETTVLYSPVLNVFAAGNLCWGNIAKPKGPVVSAMAEYERAVFESWSTHPNPGQEAAVTGKGGLVRLWDDLAARGAQRFPVQRLNAFALGGRRKGATPVTMGELIEEIGR